MFFDESPDNSEKNVVMTMLTQTLQALKPITSIIKELGLTEGENVLLMPGIGTIK